MVTKMKKEMNLEDAIKKIRCMMVSRLVFDKKDREGLALKVALKAMERLEENQNESK